jgi:Tol biopolymer transport system component
MTGPRIVVRTGLILVVSVLLAACSESTTDTGDAGGTDSIVFSLPDTLVRLTDNTDYDRRQPCWSISGRELFYTRYEIKNPGNILTSEIFSMWELNGKETQKTASGGITDFPSVRPSYIAYRSNHTGHHNIYMGALSWEAPVTDTEQKDFEVAVAPQGASGKLAFSKADTLASGGVVYYIYLLESTGLIKVSSGNSDFHPTWGILGHRIAFQRTHPGMNGAQIVVMPRYGGDEDAITTYGESCIHPDWNRARDKIAFSRSGDIFMCDPDGKNEVQLTFETQFAEYPAWSPDGNYLAYVDHVGGRYTIFVKDVKHILTSP